MTVFRKDELALLYLSLSNGTSATMKYDREHQNLLGMLNSKRGLTEQCSLKQIKVSPD